MKALAEAFKAGEAHYLAADYQEAEVRKDFIDKFWMALGWDVLHNEQKDPREQEVKIEKGVAMNDAQKRADYAFYCAPDFQKPVFFVEAKKASHTLLDEDYYFQTIRYAWYKRNAFAVLTNFTEFHILDCRFNPEISTVLERNFMRFHYSEYLDKEKFAYIYYQFSREAVAGGSLERIKKSLPNPKNKAERDAMRFYQNLKSIDDEFLEEVEKTREVLAKALKKNNDSLDGETLTFATQKIIDRLVFIRFLEDKAIEPEYYVNKLGRKGSAWDEFIALCRRLNVKYNGIVFKPCLIDDAHFSKPIDSEFCEICQQMCHLNSRFIYTEIPVYILGSIYERFLGKEVHATNKRVRIETKGEMTVRKSGGVYYTPKHIVDYIVENTVGKVIANKTPKEISQLHFADIACGSGSFLIGVFDYLLNYHTQYYRANSKEAKKAGCRQTQDGQWVLSIRQKQQILLNNIFGVDVDNQAVAVSQLSLSLKLLEDETTATAYEMQAMFHEKILPDMTQNIVCGNSLVGGDVLTQNMFSSKEERKLNPMSFGRTFPMVANTGGFDAIVGNPPYVNVKLQDKIVKNYIDTRYKFSKNADLYIAFFERCTLLTKPTGKFGYIVPNKFFGANYGKPFREYIQQHLSIDSIYDLKDENIFADAQISCVAIVFSNQKIVDAKTQIIDDKGRKKKLVNSVFDEENKIQTDINTAEGAIIQKLRKHPTLSKIADVRTGVMGFEYWKMKDIITNKGKVKSKEIKLFTNGNMGRYENKWDKEITLYNEKYQCPTMVLNRDYLSANTIDLFKNSDKIIVRGVAKQVSAYLDTESAAVLVAMHTICSTSAYNNKFLLGIINSKLINWLHLKTQYSMRIPQGSLKYSVSFFQNLPIPNLDLSQKENADKHAQLAELAAEMLSYTQHLQNVGTIQNNQNDFERNYYQRMRKEFDHEINTIVYQLYGLTPEEIAVIEKSDL